MPLRAYFTTRAVEEGLVIDGAVLKGRFRSENATETPPALITLHLANVHPKTTAAEIKDALTDCGYIRNIRVTNTKNAFVDVETKTAARKACKISPVRIRGQVVKIALASKQSHLQKIQLQKHDPANSFHPVIDESQRSTTTVFVKNLPYDMDEASIKVVFRECGRVTGVRLFLDPTTKDFKGMSFVDLENAEQVEKAIALNGKLVKGRAIVVDYTIGKKEALEAIGKELNLNASSSTSSSSAARPNKRSRKNK